jgi:predicted MFS family arabinose efflux permease
MPALDKKTDQATVPFTGYQKFVAGLLAFLQFAVILDFMVMSPLGAVIMPSLGISPARFGIVVSA